MNIEVLGCGVVHWIHLTHRRDALNTIINVNHKNSLSTGYQFLNWS